MSSEQKIFVINTMSEATYLDLSAKGAISDIELNIVDDDTVGRTVVPSYDLLGKKAGAELEYTKEGSTPYIVLKNAIGEKMSRIDASDFVKDGMLNGISYGQLGSETSSYGLKFDIKMPDGTVSAVYARTTDDAFLSTSTNAVTNRTVVSGFMLVEGSIKEIKKTLLGFDEKLNILDRKFDSLEQLNQQMPPQDQAVNDTVKVIQNDVVIYYTVTEEDGVKTWTETKREDAAFIPTQNIDASEAPGPFAAGSSNDYSRLSSDARVPSSKLISQMFASTDADIAEVAAETAKKTQRTLSSAAGTAEVFNETDGGGAKFTTYDGKVTSYVGVNDPSQSGSISGIAGQLYVVGNQRTKLNMYDGRFCYVKGDNPTEAAELAKREIAVMEDVLLVSSDMRDADRTLSVQLADARATLASVSADYLKSSDRTELSDAIVLKADADDLTALAGTVNAISGDYLKAADKTELSDAILLKADQTTFELSVQTLESYIGTKADKTALDELSGTVGSISADYLKSSDKAELTGAIAAKADKTVLELSVQNLVDADATKADLTALNDYYTKSETEAMSAAIVEKDTVTVAKLDTAEDTFFATYEVRQNGAKVGDSINIPKDFLVKSGKVDACVEADKPIAGLKPGDKYLDFTVNAKEGEGEESHIYIDVRDLTDVYTGTQTDTVKVDIGPTDNSISATLLAGKVASSHLSSGCVTMPKLADEVSSFVTCQYDNAVEYTDDEINALSDVYLSKIDGGTVAAEVAVKGGLTIKDSSLFIPGHVGPYSNLSIGNKAFLIENVTSHETTELTVSYPSETGTLAVKSDIVSAVNDLSNSYWKKAETSSATELTDKFGTLSTYAEVSAQLSSDGYALVSKTSSDTQLTEEFARQSNVLKGIISGLWSGLSGYAYQDEEKTVPKTSATITVDDLAATLTNVMSFISSAWFSMNA